MTVERGTIRMGLCFDHALSPEEQQQIETRIAQLLHAADSGAILELVRFEGEPGCPTRMTATILAAPAVGERLREAFGVKAALWVLPRRGADEAARKSGRRRGQAAEHAGWQRPGLKQIINRNHHRVGHVDDAVIEPDLRMVDLGVGSELGPVDAGVIDHDDDPGGDFKLGTDRPVGALDLRFSRKVRAISRFSDR
jgi:hypothetical protein